MEANGNKLDTSNTGVTDAEKIKLHNLQFKSIGIIGVYPPPYGGISVHIERLYHALKARGITCTVYNGSETGDEGGIDQSSVGGRDNDGDIVPVTNIESWCWRYLLQKNEDIIHNHFLRWQVRFILSLLKLKGKRVIHTLHSYRSDDLYSLPIRWMIRMTGWLSDHFVVVNEEIKKKLIGLGIAEKKISVIPSFIPPAEQSGLEIPSYIEDFYDRHEKVVLANGGAGNFYKGTDLYGLDLCVEVMERLRAKRSDVGLIYCITHVVDTNQLAELKEQIRKNGLEQHILFVHEKMPLYPLIQKSALFVRPTFSDGDAVSIREAIYYDIPVVASDVVQRPQGTVLFENRNVDDFAQKCDMLLTDPSSSQGLPAEDQEIYLKQLLQVLR